MKYIRSCKNRGEEDKTKNGKNLKEREKQLKEDVSKHPEQKLKS